MSNNNQTNNDNLDVEDDALNNQRGFSNQELKTCIKVLTCLKNDPPSLKDKRYRQLRVAGQIFVELASQNYFQGQAPNDYHKNKRRKIERKIRRKQEEQEDQERISQTEIRSAKLRQLEQLTEQVEAVNPELTQQLFLEDIVSRKRDATRLIEQPSPENTNNNNNNTENMDFAIQNNENENDEDAFDFLVKRQKKNDEPENELHTSQECYICKANFWKLHHFYDKLCTSCADLNWTKRNQVVSFEGRVALVTGGRVKIGYATALFLARNGATVIVTSRFPNDTAARYSKEPDFASFKDRIHIYGLDMRFLKDVEQFTNIILSTYNRLDIIINNAAQSIRRPPAYYAHLIQFESVPAESLPIELRPLVRLQHPSNLQLQQGQTTSQLTITEVNNDESNDNETGALTSMNEYISSAVLSQMPVAPEDEQVSSELFPQGVYDENNQQIDLRKKTSWILEHDEVSPVELAEVHAINALAPYIINSKLLPLLRKSPAKDKFIINVSSIEGQFYHRKSTKHPHTNASKAALNMMTRTSAAYFAKFRVWMNSVDTGWISDMNPVSRSVRIAKKYKEHFRNPLDELDAVARILDPIAQCIKENKITFGRLIKDYQIAPW